MSESRARDERREYEERQAKQQREQQDLQVRRVVAEIKKNYESIKALCPEVSPEAFKALLYLRKRLRVIRGQWKIKQLDPKVPHQEKDVLLGQYNSTLLVFDILDQIRQLNNELVKNGEGKEEEYVRERFFKPRQPRG